MLDSASPTTRGAVAGIAAAAAVAAWFLVIDSVRGTPFHTPGFLAAALTGRGEVLLQPGAIAVYTVLHFLVFAAIGAAAAWVHERTRTPAHLAVGVLLGVLLFDVLFLGGLAATGTDVLRGLGWPAALAGNLIGGITLVTGLHLLRVGPDVSWIEPLRQHDTVRRGLTAGALAACAVAALYLIIDTAQGQPFFTPAALGSALFNGARGAAEVRADVATVLGYTVLHVAAFLAAGMIAAVLARAAERQPPVLFGIVLLFVTFEALFFGLLAIAELWLLDALSFWTIVAANVLAAGVMAAYLWREHPALHTEMRRADLEGSVV